MFDDEPPLPSSSLWKRAFYEPGYLGMVKRIDLNLKARRVGIYSNSTSSTNPLARRGYANREAGILAMAELEVYGTPEGEQSTQKSSGVKC